MPTRLLPMDEPPDRWNARRCADDALVRNALPQLDALTAFDAYPELNRQLLGDEDSWAGPQIARRMGLA